MVFLHSCGARVARRPGTRTAARARDPASPRDSAPGVPPSAPRPSARPSSVPAARTPAERCPVSGAGSPRAAVRGARVFLSALSPHSCSHTSSDTFLSLSTSWLGFYTFSYYFSAVSLTFWCLSLSLSTRAVICCIRCAHRAQHQLLDSWSKGLTYALPARRGGARGPRGTRRRRPARSFASRAALPPGRGRARARAAAARAPR